MSRQPSLLDEGRIIDVDIAERLERSFLDYSMSVIVSRALPDVRDGLKPVQRRILYAMFEAGLRADRPARKCAAVIGDVMKRYHPHGDTSIYDALVRMAQDFVMREPLVDGHGNFGSVDGDPAAAHRYTEARLSELAMELLAGIDEDCVDFEPNYDGYETQPVVLPARVPNLLVNGASGIAVGMATSIPPHNLAETVDACLHLLAKPGTTVEQLMRIIPGPDFPTGARIVEGPGIRDAYLTGRGAVTMEAVAATETRSGGLPRIVITELPYQVNKATLLEKVAELVKGRKLDAIRDLRDESSRDGMRVVIELKRGEDPTAVLRRLYEVTDLRTNFNVNFVALVGGQPRTLGLVEALRAYVAHQREVLTRRTGYRRDKAAARLHVLEGLLIALDHLDEVITLIRSSETVEVARAQLMARYELSDVQATAILDMQLRRLAALERRKLAEEHDELIGLVAELEAILADPARLDALLATELRELKARHGNPRRSRIVAHAAPSASEADARPADDNGAAPALLEAQAVAVYVSAAGYVKSVPARRTAAPHTHPGDPVVALLRATTDDTLLLVDADGGGYRIALADVPVTTMRQRGVTVAQLLGDPPAAQLVGAIVLRGAAGVLTVSANGLVKRTDAGEYSGRTRAMIAAGVRDGDHLVAVVACAEGDHLLVAHSGGQVARLAVADVRPMGRGAAGVGGMQIPPGRVVVSASVIPAGADAELEVLTVGSDGGARRTPLAEYPLKRRGGKGVQAGAEPLAWCGLAADLQVPTADGYVVLRPADVPQGRRAARLGPGEGAISGPAVAEWSG